MSDEYVSSSVFNSDDEKLYPVDKIVGKRIRKGKVEYRVRWKNYSPETDSWEPSKSLYHTCRQLIKDYNRQYKFLNSNISIPTSTESSNDASTFNNKNLEKPLNNGSNVSDKSAKTLSIYVTGKSDSENTFQRIKSKENHKTLLTPDKNHSEINEKHHLMYPKLQNNSDNFENHKNPIKSQPKDSSNAIKIISRDLNKKNNDSEKLIEQSKDQKKVIYLEDNEIDEPNVPKSKTPSINGVFSNTFAKRLNLPNLIEKSNESAHKSVTDLANNLKRKSISVIIGNNQKKSKLNEKESKINPISVYENDQIQHLKKLINNNTLDCGGIDIKSKLFKPTQSQSILISEEKMDKCLKNLPYQRYKEAEHVENCESIEVRRTSIRQIEATNRFREIIVRKNVLAGFTEICLHNNSHSFPNCFNIKILNELYVALKQAINDSSRVILLSAIGSVFSSGIDLKTIISSQKYNPNIKNIMTTAQLTNPLYPNQHINDLAESLKKFLLELLHFPKPIIVGINGPAIGLGCAILPLCDLIYATESSSFYLPYTILSQTPEAGASLTLPMLVGMPTANQLLLCGRKWSAKEALNKGLISEIIFSDKFKAELFSRCEKLAHVPSMSVERMKCMLRIHYIEQIDLAITMECRKLVEIWKSSEFRNSAQSFIDNELPNLLL